MRFFSPVTYTRISPVEYEIALPKGEYSLVLNQTFHPLWAYKSSGNAHVNHYKNELGMNEWRIKNISECKARLYFRPQTWVNIGLIVSLFSTTVLILLSLLSFSFFSKNKR